MVISLILNCAIAVMVLFAFFAMYFNWNFMGRPGKLDSPGKEMFIYFTIDSNLLAGLCSLIVVFARIAALGGGEVLLSPAVCAVKLMGTSAVTLTLLVTVFFLAPHAKHPLSLFYNGNLFFHLIIPLVAILSFVWTDHTSSLPFTASVLGVVPTLIYAVLYMINVFREIHPDSFDGRYDFYNFLNGKKERAPFVFTAILLVSFLISLLLWRLNGLAAG